MCAEPADRRCTPQEASRSRIPVSAGCRGWPILAANGGFGSNLPAHEREPEGPESAPPLVAPLPGEGSLTERTPAVRPVRREQVLRPAPAVHNARQDRLSWGGEWTRNFRLDGPFRWGLHRARGGSPRGVMGPGRAPILVAPMPPHPTPCLCRWGDRSISGLSAAIKNPRISPGV